ncbi:MAG TPA: PQQ-binding-like beta-propeller repeat protein [Ktedonobacterales bacterium]|nr:PQQ-binding-like beta-propeller repeat protein [Ktedonobacterales bacterium]
MAHARWGVLPALALVLALVLALAGCGAGTTPVIGQPTPTAEPPTGVVYIQGGALGASDGAVRWSADLGSAPPLIAGGIAYAVTSAGTGQATHEALSAVRLADGTTAWTYALPADSAAGPMTLTDSGLLVVATAEFSTGLGESLRLVALRTSGGGVAWQSAPLAVVRRPTVDTPVPFVSALASAGGRVIALADTDRQAAFAIAWSATDGSVAWRLPLPNAGAYAGAGADLRLAGGKLVVAWGGAVGETLGALDVARGAWAWTHDAGGAGLDLVTDSALLLSDDASVTALRPTDGTTLWTRNLGAGVGHMLREMGASSTAAFYGNFVACPGATTTSGIDLQVVACQQLSAVSLGDGKVLWQRQLGLSPIYDATETTYGGGALYYQYFTGSQASDMRVTLLAFDATRGGQLWSSATGGLFETMAAGTGAVYGIGPAQGGACPVALTGYSSQNGQRLWQQPYTPCPQSFIGGLSRFPWLALG